MNSPQGYHDGHIRRRWQGSALAHVLDHSQANLGILRQDNFAFRSAMVRWDRVTAKRFLPSPYKALLQGSSQSPSEDRLPPFPPLAQLAATQAAYWSCRASVSPSLCSASSAVLPAMAAKAFRVQQGRQWHSHLEALRAMTYSQYSPW